MRGRMMAAAALAVALWGVVVAGALAAQQPADVAAKLSGDWVLNVTANVESLNLVTPDRKAVFDRR